LHSRINGLETGVVESKNLITEINTSLHSRINSFDNKQGETKNLIEHVQTSLQSHLDSLQNVQTQSKNLIVHLDTSLQSHQGEMRNMLSHLNSSLHLRIDAIENAQASAGHSIDEVKVGIGDRVTILANEQFESKNLLTHLDSSLQSGLNRLETVQSESRNILNHVNTSVHTRLNVLENEKLNNLSHQLHELAAAQFELRTLAKSNQRSWVANAQERYASAKRRPFKFYLARAQRKFPRAYPLWKERLDAMQAAFLLTKVGNASRVADAHSRVFRSFFELHADGRVLDVGCGVFGRPYYLSSYPAELISGLDPLAPVTPPDFEFVRGISEYLPWRTGAFSTVVSATALDHSLSLEHSIAEIWRVLRPKGRFLLWIDSVPGAPRYDANNPSASADRFHLFHFDVEWFEPMIEH
jgi:SAM-dependent methyltransferase